MFKFFTAPENRTEHSRWEYIGKSRTSFEKDSSEKLRLMRHKEIEDFTTLRLYFGTPETSKTKIIR